MNYEILIGLIKYLEPLSKSTLSRHLVNPFHETLMQYNFAWIQIDEHSNYRARDGRIKYEAPLSSADYQRLHKAA
jgi:hypothetical protein